MLHMIAIPLCLIVLGNSLSVDSSATALYREFPYMGLKQFFSCNAVNATEDDTYCGCVKMYSPLNQT
eukprot:4286911-Ditylum_brightwellii.AAC.1